MPSAFGRLLVRSWGAMISASSTSTFGFFCWMFGGAVAIWIAQVSYDWFSNRTNRLTLIAIMKRNWKSFFVEVGALTILTLAVWSAFIVRTVYYERTGMRWAYLQEVQRNKDMGEQLDRRKSHMDISDPAFGNTAHLLSDFSSF